MTTQSDHNELARKAASLSYQIRRDYPNTADWKAQIQGAPPELRECLREFLLQAYRAQKKREQPKRCRAGDVEIEKLKGIVG